MENRTAPFSSEPCHTAPEPATLPLCPFCGGCFQLLGGQRRCVRCSYSLCDGCEGGPDETAAHALG